MKRIISAVIVLVLVLSLLPAGALQAQAATGGKLVALTFDDGPSSKYTPELLDGLKARGVQVTFFVLGERAEDYPDIVRRAYEEGHEIASHTYDHENLNELSKSEIQSEISMTEEILDEICGPANAYIMRPPYGNANDTVKSVAKIPLIYWSVDTRDWDVKDADIVCENIVNDTFDGAIVLCHDIHKTTIPGALAAIDELLEQGYEFVTVSELYRRRGVEMQDGVLHYSCKPNGTDHGNVAAPKISYSIPGNGKATITISGSSGVPIYYTTDGSYPDGNAKEYTGPFQVAYGTKVTAVAAYHLNGDRSANVTLTVPTSSSERCKTPEISLNEDGRMVLTAATPGSRIYYTLDNTVPGTGSSLYESPVEVPAGSYIRVMAADGYHKNSTEAKGYYSEYGRLYLDMDPGYWYYEAMEKLNRMGILNGTSEYRMDPNGKLTRGMLVTLLYRYDGEKLEENWTPTNTFADVEAEAYYGEAVEWAYRNGIVNGYSETKFAPDNQTTRQELCKIVNGFLTYREKPLEDAESCRDQFTDYNQVADWAVDGVDNMVYAGMIQGDGDGNLRPNDSTTRAEFCAVLCRVMDYEETYVPPVVEEPTEETEPTETPTDEPTEETEPIQMPTEQPGEETEPTVIPTEEPTEETEPTEEPTEETEPTEEPTEETEPTEESTGDSSEETVV